MTDSEGDQPLTRRQWAKGLLLAIGIFCLNHWYFVGNDRFYIIAVWGAPLFAFVCLLGVIVRDVTRRPWLTIAVAVGGLAAGLVAHWRIYGF